VWVLIFFLACPFFCHVLVLYLDLFFPALPYFPHVVFAFVFLSPPFLSIAETKKSVQNVSSFLLLLFYPCVVFIYCFELSCQAGHRAKTRAWWTVKLGCTLFTHCSFHSRSLPPHNPICSFRHIRIGAVRCALPRDRLTRIRFASA
jgi:hypothetical protein